MPINLSGRPFLRLLDFSTEEIEYLLKLSKNFKDLKRTGTPHRYLEGKNIVLLFQKTSTRTRCAFEVGAMDLGMGVTYLDPGSSQMGKKESIEDTARVLGRFYDGIEFRGFAQTDVEDLAENAGVPVWNGLTTEWHPTQMLADILTVQENFNYDIKGLKFVFFGDLKNNMGRSLMVMCAKLGMNFVGCGPKDCWMDDELIKTCEGIAAENGCTVKCTDDVKDACTGADVIYTDVWVSMGEPDEVWAERIKHLEKFRVTKEVMAMANPDAIFMVWYNGYTVNDTDYAGEQVVELITENPAFASLDAVKNDRVFAINLNNVYCSGMRTLDGVLDFAQNLYPELYQ